MKLPVEKWISKEIFLSQIDWADTTFRMTYNRPIPLLVQSIQKVGLQNRPVLQKKGPDQYRLVSGYRRLLALLKLKEKSLLGHIAPEETAVKELLLFNFHDNLDRGFNPVEQALVVKRLSGYLAEEELVHHILPLLSLPPKKESLTRTLILSEVSPLYLPALQHGRLFPEILELVVRQFHSTADLILALFIFFRWSFQKQKEFLFDLMAIAQREGQAVEAILTASAFTEGLHSVTGTPQQKGEALRKYLRLRLYPILSETEMIFKEKVSDINPDPRTRITPPPFFEGGQYGLEIKFTNPQELSASLEKISQALAAGKFDRLP